MGDRAHDPEFYRRERERARLGDELYRRRLIQKYEEHFVGFRSKQRLGDSAVPFDAPLVDIELKKSCPAVHEYFTEIPPDSPKDCQTATLLFFAESGVFKVCLNDRSAGYSVFATGGSIWEALLNLDAMLQSGNADWRASKRKRA